MRLANELAGSPWSTPAPFAPGMKESEVGMYEALFTAWRGYKGRSKWRQCLHPGLVGQRIATFTLRVIGRSEKRADAV